MTIQLTCTVLKFIIIGVEFAKYYNQSHQDVASTVYILYLLFTLTLTFYCYTVLPIILIKAIQF